MLAVGRLMMNSTVEIAERLVSIVDLQQEILTAVADPEKVVHVIVEKVHELTGGTGAMVELVHDEDLFYLAASGTASAFVGFHVPIDGSLSGRAVREKSPMQCDNADLDPRVDGEACRTIGVRSMIIAPLLHGEVVLGALKSISTQAGAFRDIDAYVLQILAGITSSALVRARELRERQASEQRYRMLFDKNVAGVFRSTRSGKILDCNDALVEYLGYGSRDELLAREAWELYQQRSDRQHVLENLERDHAVRNARIQFRKKDGSPMIGILNMSVIPSDDGEEQLLGTMVEYKTGDQ